MLNKILRLIFYWPIRLTTNCNPVPFEPLKAYNIDKNKPIVYLVISSSIGNLLTLERLTKKLGLPSPFSQLEINGSKMTRIAYIRKPRLFTANAKVIEAYDVFQRWYELAKNNDTDIQVIPVTILWSRNPSYDGIALRGVDGPTSSFRKFLTLTFAGFDNATILAQPFKLSNIYDRLLNGKNPALFNRALKLHFLKMARSVVGQAFPNRKTLIEELLKKKGTIAAIEDEMLKTNQSREDLENKAYAIFDQMVADTRYPLIKFLNNVISFFWKKFYKGQTIIGANRVRELVKSGHEIIYIPCHRSHMDYILLSFVIFHEGLPIPQIASGDNLNFFPVGPIIRRCGSYFIRRKMKGDTFYTAMFREYLGILFEKGYATEFFIEGGRSRTGRTLPPRTGMVSMAVQSQLKGIDRPIAIIPTYLGYEHVSEVGSYMQELSGATKAKESAKDLLGIFKRFRYYGRGYVTFGEPIIIPKYLSRKVDNWRNNIDESGCARPQWLYTVVNDLSRDIIIKLNDAATVNGINLCALAIINDEDKIMSMRVLRLCIDLFITLLKCDKTRNRRNIPQDSIDTLIKQAIELKKFHCYDVGDMKFVRPSNGQILQLMYFQNNILHLFALPALIANILIRNGHITREEVRVHTRSLFYFLRHELYVSVDENSLDEQITNYIDTFIEQGYITASEYNSMLYISGDGSSEFQILSRSIRPSLLRYLIAVVVLTKNKQNQITPGMFIEKCKEVAKKLPKEISTSPEFADPIMFKIMTDTFIRHKYLSLDENGIIIVNEQKIDKLARATKPLLGAKDVKILFQE